MTDARLSATLRVIRDHVVLTERALDAALTIGRLPDNDLVLDDSQVSGHHGRLERVEGPEPGGAGWRYTDVGSTNGTTVAGGAVLRSGQSALLREDTQLLLGNTVLDLRLGEPVGDSEDSAAHHSPADRAAMPAPRDAPTAGATVGDAVAGHARAVHAPAVRSPAVGSPAVGAAAVAAPAVGAPAATAMPPGRARLIVVIGGRATVVPIRGSSAVLGRGAGCDVRIDDPSVSALQARLSHEGDQWLLTDLSATNPTRLGLRRVVGAEPVADGAHLIAGAADLLFVCDDATDPATAQPMLDERALQLAQRDQRLTESQAREAKTAVAAGGVRLGEFLVSKAWLSPGAWVELQTEAHAPETARDVFAATRRSRRIIAALLIAAALAAAGWLAVSALA